MIGTGKVLRTVTLAFKGKWKGTSFKVKEIIVLRSRLKLFTQMCANYCINLAKYSVVLYLFLWSFTVCGSISIAKKVTGFLITLCILFGTRSKNQVWGLLTCVATIRGNIYIIKCKSIATSKVSNKARGNLTPMSQMVSRRHKIIHF